MRIRARLVRPIAGVGPPALATVALLAVGGASSTLAALVYVPAVMAAAALGGTAAGIAASVLSFLGLNFFFTEPVHTLRVEHAEDLLALAVFLFVSVGVATLLAQALRGRELALRREREARLLQVASVRLLAGDPLEEVLRGFARSVVPLFGLHRCEIEMDGVAAAVAEGDDAEPGGPPTTVPMRAGGREVGRLTFVPSAGRGPITAEERATAEAFGGQVALAIEAARLAEEASRARTDAEASSLRAALLSAVTHDLRTPLASITAAVTNLLDEGAAITEEDRREALETIREEAGRLNRMVGNLMQLARARAGALVPQRRRASINEVIEGVVARLRPLLGDRPVRLMLREDLPEVEVDVEQIDQVLSNLLDNAVRHGGPASEISVSSARWQRWIEVRVTDHGPGIPAEDRERVFEPFVRREGGTGGGTGLGLSIARALVEAHGGRIWIEGAPGGGTCVVFQLPIAG